ncbi:MAG: mandelate racemase/muconate lactonizing enzyme family protein [Magnetococcales bacterium]|nr:mandelate racemase/muconate lactonizing enzyme family protein [Magnetococcales bacterium]
MTADQTDSPLREIRWGRCIAPLKQPYRLSFTELHALDVVWVRLRDALGRVGLGEAVALPGYGRESADDIAATVSRLLQSPPSTASQLRARALPLAREHPFAVSAILTALELPDHLAAISKDLVVPLALPLAGDAPVALFRERLLQGLARGWRSFKIKVGRDCPRECANLIQALTLPAETPFDLSCDANQGYELSQSLTLAATLEQSDPFRRLLWMEQPLDQQDWTGLTTVCQATPVPILLDESIHDAADIRRAADIGARGVKLKLCKHPGIDAVLSLIQLARDLNLRVVFGNGVAGDIGALGEMAVIARAGHLLDTPLECNGFSKLATPLLATRLWQEKVGAFQSLHDGDTLVQLLDQEQGP